MSGQDASRRIGRYEIIASIGEGAMGIVYLAHDPVLERDVALKVMGSKIAHDSELTRRFEREAKAVARMAHPNVVTVHDLGSDSDGSLYIAMELLRGQDLARALRDGPPLTLSRKLSIVVKVLAGLAHAHEAGLVHRDIKPANVFLTHDGGVKIMDFGVARLASVKSTSTGQVVGTAAYMSPEQVQGAGVDGRSDLFSVGGMLYELLTGRRPFESEDVMAVLFRITFDEPDLSLLPEDAEHAGLRAVVRKALAKDVHARYQTAGEFGTALRGLAAAPSALDSDPSVLEGLLASGTAPRLIFPTDVSPATTPATGTIQSLPARLRARSAPPPVPVAAPDHPRTHAGLAVLVVALIAGGGYLVYRASRPVPAGIGVTPASPAALPTSSPIPSEPASPAASPSPSPTPLVASPAPREPARTADRPSVRPPTPTPGPAVPKEPTAPKTPAVEPALMALLSEAEAAFGAERYDAAIELYDRALELDPANQRAGTGKSNALGAKAMSRASSGAAKRASGGAFVAGPTAAIPPEGEEDGAEGFERTPGVVARPGDQLAALPGKIQFDVTPDVVKPGVPFTIKVYLLNGGSAPIRIREVRTLPRINGRAAGGVVPSLTRESGPRERSLLLSLSDYWRDDVASWSLEVVVKTDRGETYRSQLTWK